VVKELAYLTGPRLPAVIAVRKVRQRMALRVFDRFSIRSETNVILGVFKNVATTKLS
jgi:hypothetical protein